MAASWWRVSAPIRTSPPSPRTYDSSPMRPMSMSTLGAASRSFMSGSREWPPAMSLASSPCSVSAAMASSTEPARW